MPKKLEWQNQILEKKFEKYEKRKKEFQSFGSLPAFFYF
jgi:hypothetical protein